jgi:hypothetical protein
MFRIVSTTLLAGVLAVGQEALPTPDRLPFAGLEIEGALAYQSRMRQAQAAATAYEERRLRDRINRFAAAFNQLTEEYGKKRTFNVKLAREVSEAFRALEKDGFLPNR